MLASLHNDIMDFLFIYFFCVIWKAWPYTLTLYEIPAGNHCY